LNDIRLKKSVFIHFLFGSSDFFVFVRDWLDFVLQKIGVLKTFLGQNLSVQKKSLSLQ
jgi:hypothetical protein